MAKASDILGDRWSLLILREAIYGVTRFADIQADIGVPRSVLTARLAKLVEAGLLERFDYREAGARPRKAYRMTARGRDLAFVFLAMKQWWDAGADADPAVRFVRKGTGQPITVVMVDDDGAHVDVADIRLRLE